jgi:SAM-dependent methyltransferase
MAMDAVRRFVLPVLDLQRLLTAPREYLRYARDLRAYRALPGAEPLEKADLFPQLWDRVPTSPYDAHYFFQDVWAARHIAARMPERHVDVGSRLDLVGFLTALTEVVFVDIRPLEAQLPNLTSVAGNVTALPFPDGSEDSVSCLHVAEHIGLGRYGDPLDPDGTRKAARELARVLRPGGQLLFSLPVGRPRVQFNAHRIHDPLDVVAMFPDLELVEFSGIDDDWRFASNRDLEELRGSSYATGLFRFARSSSASS